MINFIFRLFRLKKITSRVFFLVAILIVLSGSLHLLAYMCIDKRLRLEDTEASLANSLSNQQMMLESWALHRAKDVRYLANMPATKKLQLDHMEQTFRTYIQHHDELRSIVFIDADGFVRIDTAAVNTRVNSSKNLRDRHYFAAAERGEEYMTEVISRATNEPIMLFSTPVFSDDGAFQGVVFGAVHLTEIERMLNEMSFVDNRNFFFINENKSILARSMKRYEPLQMKDQVEIESLNTILTDAITHIDNSHDEWLMTQINMIEYTNHDGDEVYGSYIPIFDGKYYLINEMSKKAVLQTHYQIIFIMLSITLLIIGLSILLIIPVSKHLLRPFFYVVKAMNRIKSGNYKSVLDVETFSNAPLELQKFLNMFNLMSVTIQEHHDTLQELSSTDDLTGLANRRMFEQYLEREWANAKRMQCCLSIAFIDIDLFKQYNDTYGHQAGDECLVQVANVIKQSIKRPRDLAVRYGGEEFVIILPDTCHKNALFVAERLRKNVEQLHRVDSINRKVTVSIGVASLTPTKSLAKESLIALADQALYEAKSRGRNQIVAKENLKMTF